VVFGVCEHTLGGAPVLFSVAQWFVTEIAAPDCLLRAALRGKRVWRGGEWTERYRHCALVELRQR
jgi:hypothetical protein